MSNSYPLISTELSNFAPYLPKSTPGRIIAFDVGKKYTGSAISDDSRFIASILERIHFRNPPQLHQLIQSYQKKPGFIACVIGWPLQMDGIEGSMCQWVREWVVEYIAPLQLPVWLVDERLTSSAAMRMLSETDLSRKRKQTIDDQVAATYLLQGALDRLCQYNQ
jgi:putative Holliday junction resolvase